MNWNYQFEPGEPTDFSQIPVTSHVKQRKAQDCCQQQLNTTSNHLDLSQDKHAPSTNVGSDLQPPQRNTITLKQRNMLLGLSDLRQSETVDNQLKRRIRELMKQVDELQSHERAIHAKFGQEVETLRETLKSRATRNAMMKAELESLRKDLTDGRQEMKVLIHVLKTAGGPRQDINQSPKVQTLKHYESQKFLHLAQKQQAKLQNSAEKSDKKIKTLHGRRMFIRDKSDSGRKFH